MREHELTCLLDLRFVDVEAQTLDCNFKRLVSVSAQEASENFREASISYRGLVSVRDLFCEVKMLYAREDALVDVT